MLTCELACPAESVSGTPWRASDNTEVTEYTSNTAQVQNELSAPRGLEVSLDKKGSPI